MAVLGRARLRAAALCAIAAAGAATQDACAQALQEGTAPEPRVVLLRAPSTGPLTFRGMANFDQAGMGHGGMLYQAPNAAGLVVAILTHSALVAGARKSEKDELQEKADQVLLPYKPVIDAYGMDELLRRVVEGESVLQRRVRLAREDEAPGNDGILVEAEPVFLMTPDQTAIVLENAVSLRRTLQTGDEVAPVTVRVVSAPVVAEGELVHFWSANGGERLKQATARLFGDAVAIALRHADGPGVAHAPQRTVRYPLGGAERMERAALLEERCDRIVIRTLRGALMSVPRRNVQPGDCVTQPSAIPAKG